MSNLDFKNKKVWITGASSGIGEALAYKFSELGAFLIISSRRENELLRVKNACKNPENVEIVPLDLEKYEQIADIVNPILQKIGNVDILINNGGASQRALVVDEDLDVIVRMMKINFMGAAALTKVVLPGMISQKFGHIVCMSSLAGKFGIPLRSGYAAAKHALHGFFETLRAENYDNGIRVMMVCPGYINTNVALNALNADGSKRNINDKGQEQGLDPAVLAEKIIKGIKKEKLEITAGGGETNGIWVSRFFPNLFAKIIRKKK
ncbi:MAG: SDR family oxidoreductase [Bacteroidales bacterium]|nr:SDR family oxidoreductase [Bacteroidales bacterium]